MKDFSRLGTLLSNEETKKIVAGKRDECPNCGKDPCECVNMVLFQCTYIPYNGEETTSKCCLTFELALIFCDVFSYNGPCTCTQCS